MLMYRVVAVIPRLLGTCWNFTLAISRTKGRSLVRQAVEFPITDFLRAAVTLPAIYLPWPQPPPTFAGFYSQFTGIVACNENFLAERHMFALQARVHHHLSTLQQTHCRRHLIYFLSSTLNCGITHAINSGEKQGLLVFAPVYWLILIKLRPYWLAFLSLHSRIWFSFPSYFRIITFSFHTLKLELFSFTL